MIQAVMCNSRVMYIVAAWPHELLTYQFRTVVLWITVAITGNRELGFDTGEGAWYTATTAKVGSRHNKGHQIHRGAKVREGPGNKAQAEE